MKYQIVRTLICKNVRTISQLCHDAKKNIAGAMEHTDYNVPSEVWRLMRMQDLYDRLRREATIWHDVAHIIKGGNLGVSSFDLCAGRGHNVARYNVAKRRIEELTKWVERHPREAEKMCQPLWAEYDEREARRNAKKEEKHEVVCVGS